MIGPRPNGLFLLLVMTAGLLLVIGPRLGESPSPDHLTPEWVRLGETSSSTSTTTRILADPVEVGRQPVMAKRLPDRSTTTTTTPATTTSPTNPTTTSPPDPTTSGGPDGGPNPAMASQFAANINDFRQASGLDSLQRNGSLDAEAQSWAEAMAGKGELVHSDLGRLLPPWSAVAENIAYGGSVGSVFGALTGSSGHEDNMLGDYTDLGVGVWVDSDGLIWTVHLFAR